MAKHSRRNSQRQQRRRKVGSASPSTPPPEQVSVPAFDLAWMYAHGKHGVSKDLVEADRLWTIAHNEGDTRATTNLANLYAGHYGAAAAGVTMPLLDWEKAIQLYQQAAEAGDAQAQFNLGICYYKGMGGVAQSSDKAKMWYAKAAKQGHLSAMTYLAGLLRATYGDAVLPAAMALLREAADRGNRQARRVLGMWEAEIWSKCASCGSKHRNAEVNAALAKCQCCKAAAYCSLECQLAHWAQGGHKKACTEREKYLPEKKADKEEEKGGTERDSAE